MYIIIIYIYIYIYINIYIYAYNALVPPIAQNTVAPPGRPTFCLALSHAWQMSLDVSVMPTDGVWRTPPFAYIFYLIIHLSHLLLSPLWHWTIFDGQIEGYSFASFWVIYFASYHLASS